MSGGILVKKQRSGEGGTGPLRLFDGANRAAAARLTPHTKFWFSGGHYRLPCAFAPCTGAARGGTVEAMDSSENFGLPTASDVDAAAERMAGVVLRTPLISSPTLDALTGGRVLLKAETLQRTGSFKFRGAYNRLSAMSFASRRGGVVAYSSGNHAQGVAAAAKLLDMPAVIVMPRDAPRPKRERTAALGAEVVLYDREAEDREAIARGLAEARGAVLVPPYDDPLVIAGQGTAGREIAEDVARLGHDLDCVLVNASGGGLAAGIALAVKARFPAARILTAEPAGFDDHARSFRSGRRERNPALTGTICDSLMAQTPGRLTFEINWTLVGEGVTATEEEVGHAVAFAFRELKLVVEPGGAVALAALLAGRLDARRKTVVAVLSGGNVDPLLFARLVA
jgi:threonine dehydratase